jgi:hypothetical protein
LFSRFIALVVTLRWIFRFILFSVFLVCVVFKVVSLCRFFESVLFQARFNLLMVCFDI